MNEKFVEVLREVFAEALSRKTGWGKNEVSVVFEQSLSKALARLLDKP